MYEISLFHKFNETWQILLSFTNTLCYKSPRICSTCRKHFPVLCSFITGFVTRLKRRVPPVEQELPTLPEHLSSPPVFSGVCVTRSFVVCPFELFLLVIVLSVFWSVLSVFWPLCCLSFDLQILIIPLVSSNSSCWKTELLILFVWMLKSRITRITCQWLNLTLLQLEILYKKREILKISDYPFSEYMHHFVHHLSHNFMCETLKHSYILI